MVYIGTRFRGCRNNGTAESTFYGCRRSSVDLSAPSILAPRVRIPNTPSMLLSIYLWHVEKTKINWKRGRDWLIFFKKIDFQPALFFGRQWATQSHPWSIFNKDLEQSNLRTFRKLAVYFWILRNDPGQSFYCQLLWKVHQSKTGHDRIRGNWQ